MSFHTRHLEPGDHMFLPETLDIYDCYDKNLPRDLWKVVSIKDKINQYGDVHIVAESMTRPGVTIDGVFSGYISLVPPEDYIDDIDRFKEAALKEFSKVTKD